MGFFEFATHASAVIGCSLGTTSAAFREFGESVAAIDLSSIAVDFATAGFTGFDFRCAVFSMGLPEMKSFDVIWVVDLRVVGLFEAIEICWDFLSPCMKRLNNDVHVIVG